MNQRKDPKRMETPDKSTALAVFVSTTSFEGANQRYFLISLHLAVPVQRNGIPAAMQYRQVSGNRVLAYQGPWH